MEEMVWNTIMNSLEYIVPIGSGLFIGLIVFLVINKLINKLKHRRWLYLRKYNEIISGFIAGFIGMIIIIQMWI